MNYVIIRGDLNGILGKGISGMSPELLEDATGFNLNHANQIPSKGISIIGVKDITKAEIYGEIVSREVADSTYQTEQIIRYRVTSDALMNANLANCDVDFTRMSCSWTAQKELEFLYENNISGIEKIEKKALV